MGIHHVFSCPGVAAYVYADGAVERTDAALDTAPPGRDDVTGRQDFLAGCLLEEWTAFRHFSQSCREQKKYAFILSTAVFLRNRKQEITLLAGSLILFDASGFTKG